MLSKKKTNEDDNFWVSYADLMAGLLFVFILLIGAIVSKSILLKNTLAKKEEKLLSTSSSLEKNRQALDIKDDEVNRLNQLLAQANANRDMLSKKIILVQQVLEDQNTTLKKNKKSIEEYEGRVMVLSNQVTDLSSSVKSKDAKVLELLTAIDNKQTKYDNMISDLRKQKAKIKALTGIRLKVISALKEELGSNINIDKSGSLQLASNVLFGSGNALLKEENKVNIKKAFEEYVGALVSNTKIKPHLDKLIIEGHTDSDGGYLYNLELSQKRALAVMNYLTTLEFTQKHKLKPLLVASGRGYIDAIKVNGKEDKEASRRIEFKFTLKNDDAMAEIEKILDAQ